MLEFLCRVFASIAMYSATSAFGSASNWGSYQPKEPEKLKELAK